MAGVSGALYASYLSFAQPGEWSLLLSIQFVAAVIVGGMGTVAGPLLGSAVVFALPTLLKNLPFLPEEAAGGVSVSDLSSIAYGLLIVVFLVVQPRGLVGITNRIKEAHWWRQTSILAVAAVAAIGLIFGACGTGDAGETAAGAAEQGSLRTGPGVDADAKTIRVGDLNALSGPAAALGSPSRPATRRTSTRSTPAAASTGGRSSSRSRTPATSPSNTCRRTTRSRATSRFQLVRQPDDEGDPAAVRSREAGHGPGLVHSVWGTVRPSPPLARRTASTSPTRSTTRPRAVPEAAHRIIYQRDEYGADGLRGFEAAREALGLSDAGHQSYKAGDTEITAQVQKLKAAGADAVVVTALPSATGPIVGTARRSASPVWILQGPSFIEQLITEDGTEKAKATPVAPALEGAIVTSFSAPWGAKDAPGMGVARRPSSTPEQTPSIYFALAYAQGMVVEQILRKAIESGDISREGVLAAKQNLGEVDLGGITGRDVHAGGWPPSRSSLITEIDASVPGFLR